MLVDGENLAKVRTEKNRVLDLQETAKTMRRLDMFGNGKCDFEFPSAFDVMSMPVDQEARLVALDWKEDSGGIAAIQLRFSNGITSPLFTAQNISSQGLKRA